MPTPFDSRPLRVALISEHASPLAHAGSIDAGGQNVYVLHVARELARRGHQVDVLTRRDDPGLPAMVDVGPRFRVVHVDAGPACFIRKEELLPFMPAFTRSVGHLLRGSKPYNVVHANFFMSGCVGLGLQRQFQLPLVVTFHALGLVRREHQGSADGFPPQRIAIERRLVQRADRLVAECPQDRDDLVRLYGASPDRIATVPCGVDLNTFAPGDRALARARLSLSPDEFVVLQLGRMVPRKGIDNVIRALALLAPAINPRLLVVGGESSDPDDGMTPEIARLRDVARDCGVQQQVMFTGRRERDELPELYAAADVFVTTPLYEPFGITPLEAMACGIPVVGSRVGGIQHSVVDSVTGFLVPPSDPASLADRLARLHAQPVLRAALGLAGMSRARSLFTWQRVADELVKVYRSVMVPVGYAAAGQCMGDASVAVNSDASPGPLPPPVRERTRRAANDALGARA